jgi:hypothetical protein
LAPLLLLRGLLRRSRLWPHHAMEIDIVGHAALHVVADAADSHTEMRRA